MRRERISIWLALLTAACATSHDVPAPDGLDSALTATQAITLSAKCQKEVDDSQDGMPNDLECIGLFSDVPNRTLYAGIKTYTPAVELWSDGADKQRWIYLPPKTTIDSSDPGEWKFPVGTRLFKEFAYNGSGAPGAVETRLFVKVRSDYWTFTTYIWDADHKGAVREDSGRDIDVGPIGMHHVPTTRECGQCHGGRSDRILGFEAVSLGQEGAEGLTLATLVDQKLLTSPPPQIDMVVGDDGTGMGGPVISWLHINCGVTCHNDNQNAQAYQTDLRMKLDPGQLDGRPSADFSAVKSTVGVKAKSLQWSSQVRIAAGDPANSLLYKLISMRGGGKNNQMPPIASLRIDQDEVDTVAAWIRALPLPAAAADTTND